MIDRSRFATIVLALVPWVGFSAASGDCGLGEGCAEPCPSRDSCYDDGECPSGNVCDLSACIPSSCTCVNGAWDCTTDCAGQCTGGCGDSSCDVGEDSCTCPDDCGAPPSTETDCNDGLDNDCDGSVDGADADCAAPTFVIGGALFSDCSSPLGSGQAGVTVNVTCDGGFADSATSTAPFGIWQIANVHEDTCIVTVEGFFCGVDSVCPPDPCSNTVVIIVNAANQADNQSLAFGECVNLDCWFDFASCMTGPDVLFSAGCEVFDSDLDEDVDLTDAAAFQRMFAGP